MADLHPPETGTWTAAALRVMRERYLVTSADGSCESPEDMLWRVAQAVAAAERAWGADDAAVAEVAGRFYRLMVAREFLPNSPTLMNAGRGNRLQYSACYVLPVEDSIEGIFDAIKRAALIHQSGGGTGFSFSRLRPRDSRVASTGGRASGPVSFMRVFNAATEAVKQGGTRRGANMGILRVDHPDIEAFIDCKRGGDIANFNISVGVTDLFMRALDNDASYPLVDHRGEPVGERRARDVWARMVDAAWHSGDPGLVFLDLINRYAANPTPSLHTIEATNPCGEQPLAPNEACNLGSLNVSAFVREGGFDWPRLEAAVETAVRMLDDVIECNPYPLPEIDAMVKANRRIGLGVMGWADALMALGLAYDDDPALALAKRLMAFIQDTGHQASHALAEARGPFPNFAASIYADGPPIRNSTVTTIAPTGSISILAGCSSGIEPAFALAWRHVVDDRTLSFVNPLLADALDGQADAEAYARILERGTLRDELSLPHDVRRVFVTAHEIAAEWHVRMQAAFQQHTDNGVSKTVNLPSHASTDDVARAFRLAWDLGCIGITVFRDGCKGSQVLQHGAGGAPNVAPRPRKAEGATWRAESPLGTCFVTVNHNERGEPFEVFANVGKAGSDIAAVSEAMGRLISLVLRLPSPLPPSARLAEIVNQLQDIGGARPLGLGRNRVRSLPDAIARVLAENAGLVASSGDEARGDLCPECGQAALVFEEGCGKCWSCGFSLC